MINYIKFLEEYNLWPMESWNHFPFHHRKPSNTEEEKNQINILKNRLAAPKPPHPNGLYAYRKNGIWIYVGKGKPILNRVISHYRESFQPVSGDTKQQLWHRFFLAHCGDLKIYWKEVPNETDREILELTLQAELKPSFEDFRKTLPKIF